MARKRKTIEQDEPMEAESRPMASQARTLLLGGAFSVMSLIVIYNALALQPTRTGAQLASQGATQLHFDPLVENIQRELLAAGYFKGLVDGVMGEKTQTAIIAWQAAAGQLADGQPSQNLLDQIRLEQKIAAAASFTASTDDAATPKPQANSGKLIFTVQSALSDLGYDTGDITGGLTDKTRLAIKAFQVNRHLLATGEINADLLAELAKTSGYEQLAPQ